jgi:hypothetical protein
VGADGPAPPALPHGVGPPPLPRRARRVRASAVRVAWEAMPAVGDRAGRHRATLPGTSETRSGPTLRVRPLEAEAAPGDRPTFPCRATCSLQCPVAAVALAVVRVTPTAIDARDDFSRTTRGTAAGPRS